MMVVLLWKMKKKRVWIPDKKKDLNRRKGNNDSSYYFPFIFYIKKSTQRALCTRLEKKNARKKYTCSTDKQIWETHL